MNHHVTLQFGGDKLILADPAETKIGGLTPSSGWTDHLLVGGQSFAVARHPGSMRKFLRDVLVNVIANLIAAGLIYLGAVYGGYVPINWNVVIVAMLIISALYLLLLFMGALTEQDATP
jgi:hypothetical protein